MRHWAISAIFATSLALTAGPALAQRSPEDKATAEAKQRFNEGIALADAGNHEAAQLKFSQAWTLLKSPAIVYNLARSEQLSGHLVEALEHYRLFSKMASDPKVSEQQKQRAQDNIAELTRKVGQIDIDALPAAKITIDGKAVEWSPSSDPFPVLPGKHEVSAVTEGKEKTVSVECTPGTVARAKFLEPAAPPPVAPPVAPPPPSPTAPPPEPPPSFWTTGRAAGAGVVVVGLVGVGLGVVFHLKSTSAGSDADDLSKTLGPTGCSGTALAANQARCNSLQDNRDSESSNGTLRTAFFIGGGAFVVGGAALFLLAGPRAESTKSAWHVVPLLSPRESGMALTGSF